MGNVIPLSPEESNSAEGFLLCVPGRSLRRSSIRCFEALIPASYEKMERLSVGAKGAEPKSQQENKESRTETGEDVLQVLLRNDAVGVMVD